MRSGFYTLDLQTKARVWAIWYFISSGGKHKLIRRPCLGVFHPWHKVLLYYSLEASTTLTNHRSQPCVSSQVIEQESCLNEAGCNGKDANCRKKKPLKKKNKKDKGGEEKKNKRQSWLVKRCSELSEPYTECKPGVMLRVRALCRPIGQRYRAHRRRRHTRQE